MKGFKRVLVSVLALAMVLQCGFVMNSSSADAAVKVKSVKVSSPYAKKAYIAKGKSIKLSTKVTVTPNKSANKKVTFKSSKTSVVTVSSKGVVKAKKTGSAKITVTSKKNKKKKATVKVYVKEDAVKKVNIKQSKADAFLGQKLTLKATVTASKNASKLVKWTSSKTSVATVSSKGVVTPKKEGTTVIRCTALDGSNKKDSCKVTVKPEQTGITAMTFPKSSSIRVGLNKAVALTAADFNFVKKSTAAGNYLTPLPVERVKTTDNVTYDIELKDCSVSSTEYVRVTIAKLTGTSTMEAMVRFEQTETSLAESIITGKVGEKMGDNSNGEQVYGFYGLVGEITYTAANLPAGITYVVKDSSFYLRGKATAVADNVIATITATDETGVSVTKNIRFLIGSDTQIVGYTRPITELTDVYFNDDIIDQTYLAGGKGSNTYAITGVPEGVLELTGGDSVRPVSDTYDEATETSHYKTVTPATYNMVLTVTDDTNPAVTKQIPVSLTIAQGLTITGTAYDAGNEVLKDFSISFNNLSDPYGTGSDYTYVNPKTGIYTARILPGEYTVSTNGFSAYRVNFQANTVYNIQSAKYKVTLSFAVPVADSSTVTHLSTYTNWIDAADYDYDYYSADSNILYVYPGTYSLKNTDEIHGYNDAGEIVANYDGTASFTVANTNVVVPVGLVKISEVG